MTKKKKIILVATLATLLVTLILSGISFIYVQYNLATYSIYYAKHLPHAKNTNPEMVLLLENMDFISLPKVNGIEYESDNGNTNITKDNDIYIIINSTGVEIHFLKNGKSKRADNRLHNTYFFSKSGRFEKYYYQDAVSHRNVYDSSSESENQAQAYVDEVIDPIVAKMAVKPKINLQWLFNRKYQKRFSG